MKHFIAALMLSVCSIAHSESWVLIGETDSGKHVVNVDSAKHTTVDNSTYISSIFRFYKNDGRISTHVFSTNITSCVVGNGEIMQFIVQGGEVEYLTSYWWSDSNTVLYDTAGITLCKLHEIMKDNTNGKITL